MEGDESDPNEQQFVTLRVMKDEYDFSKDKRVSRIMEETLEPGKVKIPIRIDEDILDYLGA